jgi:hypothetical protein
MTRDKLTAKIDAAKAEQRRSVNLTVRLSEAERDRLQRVAAEVGLPAAVLARVLLLDGLDEVEVGR